MLTLGKDKMLFNKIRTKLDCSEPLVEITIVLVSKICVNEEYIDGAHEKIAGSFQRAALRQIIVPKVYNSVLIYAISVTLQWLL